MDAILSGDDFNNDPVALFLSGGLGGGRETLFRQNERVHSTAKSRKLQWYTCSAGGTEE